MQRCVCIHKIWCRNQSREPNLTFYKVDFAFFTQEISALSTKKIMISFQLLKFDVEMVMLRVSFQLERGASPDLDDWMEYQVCFTFALLCGQVWTFGSLLTYTTSSRFWILWSEEVSNFGSGLYSFFSSCPWGLIDSFQEESCRSYRIGTLVWYYYRFFYSTGWICGSEIECAPLQNLCFNLENLTEIWGKLADCLQVLG